MEGLRSRQLSEIAVGTHTRKPAGPRRVDIVNPASESNVGTRGAETGRWQFQTTDNAVSGALTGVTVILLNSRFPAQGKNTAAIASG